MIRISNLGIGYTGNGLASGLNAEAPSGMVTALLGSNGIGKSTLLKTITGELRALTGKVEIDGDNLLDLSRKQRAAKVAVVTTERTMTEGLTAKEVVGLGRQLHTNFFGHMSHDDIAITGQALRTLHIEHLAKRKMENLSDGERQKVLIARALAQQTPTIVLDEPFAFLDVAARVEILGRLKELAQKENKTILFSSHDIAQALRMADMLWLMTSNHSLVCDTPENVKNSDSLSGLFKNDYVKFDPIQNDFIC